MFIAKFNQASSNAKNINPNRHGQMPYMGTVLAGIATTSIVDAVIFENGNNEPGKLYLCENGEREFEGKVYPTLEIVSAVSAMEYMSIRKELGAGRRVSTTPVEAKIETPVTSGADLV
jgi:hypothetical protein